MKQIELFVPGRLCLFGEHSDWAGRYTDINSEVLPGRAIVTGIDLGIFSTAEKNDKFSITSFDEAGKNVSFSCKMELSLLKEKALEPHYFSYACGVAAYMLEHYQVSGVSIVINKVTLPIKKGLSSSAAICVLVARAFNELYNLKMSTNGEMQAAYRGELLTKSRCGRLDQACAYGVCPVCMEFSGDDISVEKLKVGKTLYWVFADLKAGKDTKKILADLNKAYPFPQNEQERNIHKALGEYNLEIIEKAKNAIATGDARGLGNIMKEAQVVFDKLVAPGCPQELTAPKLHSILEDPEVNKFSFGGKGVGSQGDGTVQFIAKDLESQKQLTDYLNGIGLEAYSFTLPSTDRVKKAIIPVAGFGTRMYPATRFVKKEFLPVVDNNGVAKPVIMYLLEELDEAGIEEIILIVGEDEVALFNSMFKTPLDEQYIEKLPERVREYEKTISRIGNKLHFAVQKERRGFGHAVYQAKQFIGDEPVLLMLGDFIYKSNENESCTMQTIKAYRKSGGRLTVAVKPISLEDVVHYGVLTGSFSDNIMKVTQMKEKPSMQYAKDYLGVKTSASGTNYFCTFGQYILTPDVFKFLEEDIKKNNENSDNSEIQLTDALCKVLESSGMVGICVKGKSYDVGIPSAFVKTVEIFNK